MRGGKVQPPIIAKAKLGEGNLRELFKRLAGVQKMTAAGLGLWALWALWLLVLFFGDVVPDFSLQKLIGLVGLAFLLGGVSLVLIFLFELFGALTRFYRTALFVALPMTVLICGAVFLGPGGFVVALFLVVATSLVAGGSVSLRQSHRSGKAVAILIVGVSAWVVFAIAIVWPSADLNPRLSEVTQTSVTLDLPDPALPGLFGVQRLTYGSGVDRFLAEYGAEADFVSRSVDGSGLDEKWSGIVGWLRTWYWGFSASQMPVQGRVWMPVSADDALIDGDYPLVMMVHGNHKMEEASDAGYAYLGEHLASHGYVVVSIDQNFLNSSTLSYINPLKVRTGSENDVRGWLLLEHLKQFQAWMVIEDHPLYAKIDLEKIVLVGHSRGGEAVAIANFFNGLGRHPDNANYSFDYSFGI